MAVLSALVPVLVLALATSRLELRCRFLGIAIDACCCPEGDAERPAQARLDAADCCELKAADATKPPAEVGVPPGGPPTPPLQGGAIVFVTPLWPAADRPPGRAVGRAPPPGPSLLLVKRSFLI